MIKRLKFWSVLTVLIVAALLLMPISTTYAYNSGPEVQISTIANEKSLITYVSKKNKNISILSKNFLKEKLGLFGYEISQDMDNSISFTISETRFLSNSEELQPDPISPLISLDKNEYAVTSLSDVSDTWTDPTNTISIISTTYYLDDYSDTYAIYKIEGHAYNLSTFNNNNRKEDQLVLLSNANYFNVSGTSYELIGHKYYHEYIYNNYGGYMPTTIVDQDVIENLVANFNVFNSVNYKFTFPANYNHNAVGGGIHFISYANYTNFSVDGCYYVVATKNSVFNSQVAYIHNYTNSSISYSVGAGSGGVSFGISIAPGTNASLYAAQPLTIFT